MKIIANLKMNFGYDEVKKYISDIKELSNNNNFIICPSNIYTILFLEEGFNVCMQNVSRYASGSHTGDVSASQISSMNIKYSLVGHAEKRHYCNETNDVINMKIKNALDKNISVILCIGETTEDRQNNKVYEVINKQLEECLKDINNIDNIKLAYEPQCSVDAHYKLPNDEIEKVLRYIDNYIFNRYLKHTELFYGGSVNENNLLELKEIDLIDGFLIGSASLESDKLKRIIELSK